MARLRGVTPARTAACEAGSSAPRYASASTITPTTRRSSTVDSMRVPRSARATAGTGAERSGTEPDGRRGSPGVVHRGSPVVSGPARSVVSATPATPSAAAVPIATASLLPLRPPSGPRRRRRATRRFGALDLRHPAGVVLAPRLDHALGPPGGHDRPHPVRLVLEHGEDLLAEVIHQELGRLLAHPPPGVGEVVEAGLVVGGKPE